MIRFLISIAFVSHILSSPLTTQAAHEPLPMLSTHGSHLVDSAGNQVVLKGCNLGNELMLESWMFGNTLLIDSKPFHDGVHVYRTLANRFGPAQTESLLDTYRTNWITPRDFELIKSFGFNVVRLPFDYRQLQNDQPPYAIKPDGFRWIDRTLAMAKAAKIYVILDLHGAPGGQSNEDHTGEAGQNKLWSSSVNQQRTVDVWHALADRYKNDSTIAAYDLINEPYGDHNTDGKPVLAALMPRIYQAIRSTGDQHVMYFPAGLNTGIRFYGDPHGHGMTNVGFTEHYYPGLYGSKSAIETQARVINQVLPSKNEYTARLSVPYFIGEFNVVLQSEACNRMMREYFDQFARYGWAGTMWSYKLIKQQAGSHQDAWYMVTNDDALQSIDLATAAPKDISSFFSSMSTMPLKTNNYLLHSLTDANRPPLYLTAYPKLLTLAPTTPPKDPAGFRSVDIGGALPGHTTISADGAVVVLAGGDDINGTGDSFRFISTTAKQSVTDVKATISSFVDTQEYAKAGVMARWGNPADAAKPDAAMAMLNIFPDGTIALITRSEAGGTTKEIKLAAGPMLPIELRLNINDGHVNASYRTVDGEWSTVGTSIVHAQGALQTGLAVCAHADSVLTTVTAYLQDLADRALTTSTSVASNNTSILRNGSFEQQGESSDQAADWNRWGDWMNRETGWTPTHSGSCEIGYHHWQINDAGSSGLWQDVAVDAGKQYTFSIYAQHDPATEGKHDASTVELRMESTTPDGQVTLNTQDFDVSKLATGKAWTRLSLSGTTESDKLRVLVIINSSADSSRGGAIKLDDAALTLPNGLAAAKTAAIPSEETEIPPDATQYPDIAYVTRPSGAVKLDLYVPAGKGPFPVVLWFHGGAWMFGDKASWPHMNFLVREGYAVANVEYRFSQVAPFPAQLEDCTAALDFLTSHATDYRLDPARIASTGESAGGNLATLLGMSRPALSEPTSAGHVRAVIDLFGPANLLDFGGKTLTLSKAVNQLLGGTPQAHRQLAIAASPIMHVEKSNPPILIFHGTADAQIPFMQSRQLADKLAATGVAVEFVPVNEAGHAGPEFWTLQMRKKMLSFLSHTLR